MASSGYLPVDVTFDSSLADNREAPVFTLRPYLDRVVGYQIMWATVPFSFYTIVAPFNTFIIKAFNGDTTPALITCTATIVPGTYTPDSLKNELKRSLNDAVGPGGPGTLPERTNFDVFIDPATAQFVIYNRSENFTVGKYFELQFLDTELAGMLGFEPSTTYRSTWGKVWLNGATVGNNASTVAYDLHSIRSPKVVNLMYSPTLNLHAEFQGMVQEAARTQDGLSQILATIPINNNFTTLLQYLPTPEMIPMHQASSIYQMKLYLTHGDRTLYQNSAGQAQNYLPLNGEGFRVCIRFYVDNGLRNMQLG